MQGNACGHSHRHSAKMLQKLTSNSASVLRQGKGRGLLLDTVSYHTRALSSELINPPLALPRD